MGKFGKGLAGTIDKVRKKFGDEAVMDLEGGVVSKVRTFPTGSVGLDAALGAGGLPYGRIVEVYGPEASGKTTLTLHAIAEVQRAGGVAAFIDAEHALDLAYAEAVGVDIGRLLLSQPSSGEEALQIVEMFASTDEVDLVVIDSVAALTPQAELDGEMSELQVGLQARLMGKALRKLNAVASSHGTTVLFINQLRQKIGVTFGSNETTTGGNALKYYASVRLDIRRIGQVKDSRGERLGNKTRVKVVKNKLAPPFREAEFEIVYGLGICQAGEVIDHGLECGLVKRSGAWFSLGDDRLGQGRENARDALYGQPERLEQLRVEMRSALIEAASVRPGARASWVRAAA